MMCSQISKINYNILNCFYKKYMIVSNILIDWANTVQTSLLYKIFEMNEDCLYLQCANKLVILIHLVAFCSKKNVKFKYRKVSNFL